MGSRSRKLRGRRDGPWGGTVSSGWASPAQLGEQGSPQGVCPSDTGGGSAVHAGYSDAACQSAWQSRPGTDGDSPRE